MIDLVEVSGIGAYKSESKGEVTYYKVPGGKVFLVVSTKTLQMRCDGQLSKQLQSQYETVMESRYFGRGGIEVIPSGQLTDAEIEDLVRLSYNLTVEESENA